VGILNPGEILVGPRNFHLCNRPLWITSAMDIVKDSVCLKNVWQVVQL